MKLRARTSTDVPWINVGKLDLIWGVAAPFLALLVRDVSLFDAEPLQNSLIYAGVGAVLTAACFIKFRLAHSLSRFFSLDDAVTVLTASAIAVISTVVVCFLITRLDSIPRTVPVLHFVVLAGGSITIRMNRYLLRRRRDRHRGVGASVKNMMVVGATDLAWYYMQIVENLARDRYNVVAVLDDDAAVQGRFVHGYPVAGRIRDIEAVVAEYAIHGVPIHRLVVAVDWSALTPQSVEQLFRVAKLRGIAVETLPERLGIAGSPAAAAGAEPDVSVDKPVFWAFKRAFDVAVAGTILLLTAPIAAIISLLVMIDCGVPIIFWQVRIGRRGDKITVSKFRTLKAPYQRSGEAIPEERRISWFGRLLRMIHLDELPQLVSIVQGRMSLIGPRPLLPVDLPARVGVRLDVRPGITGWAQINGATLVTPQEKIALDEWYVRHASWHLELAILAGTIRALFVPMRRNENAIAEALREQAARDQDNALDSEWPVQLTADAQDRSELLGHAELITAAIAANDHAGQPAQRSERHHEARVSRAS